MPAGSASNIKTLTRRYNALQKQLQQLAQEREQRQFEQALLVGLYDSWCLLNTKQESACGAQFVDEEYLLMQCELLQSLAATAASPQLDQQQGSVHLGIGSKVTISGCTRVTSTGAATGPVQCMLSFRCVFELHLCCSEAGSSMPRTGGSLQDCLLEQTASRDKTCAHRSKQYPL